MNKSNKSKAKYEWFVSPISDAKQVGRNVKFILSILFGKEDKVTDDN